MKIIIIPARMASKRFPGKPLHKIAGKPLLQWTYELAKRTIADRVVVACCDDVVSSYCLNHDIDYIWTGDDKPNGTQRCSQALKHLEAFCAIDRVVNLQVDEPLLEVDDLDVLLESFSLTGTIDTLVHHKPPQDIAHQVFVAYIQESGRCYWFSRQPISDYQHLGVYGYSATTLKMLGLLNETEYTKRESLEQLAWIEHGFDVYANQASENTTPISVNTPEDAQVLESMLA